MVSKKVQNIFLIVVVLIYAITRLAMVFQKTFLLNDEIASQIVMSGEGVSISKWYKSAELYGEWLGKEQILNEMDIDDAKLNLSGVSEMLDYNDIHPPLYFWIGNAWCGIFGLGVKSILWLHLIFELVTVLLIYKLLNQNRFYSKTISLSFAFIIVCHPFFSESFILIRHYSLLALLSTLLLYIVLQLQHCNKLNPVWLFSLFATVFLGSLTHFIFPVLVFALLFSLLLTSRSLSQFLITGIIAFLAFCTAAALNWDIFKKLILLEKAFDNSSYAYFLNYISAIPSRLILTRRMVQFLPPILLALSWLVIPWLIFKSKKNQQEKTLFLFAFVYYAIISVLVILDKTPFHSLVSNRYYAVAAAALFIALTLVLKKRNSHKIVLFIGLIFCVYGGLLSTYQARKPKIEKAISEKAIIINPGLMYLGLTAHAMNNSQQLQIASNTNDLNTFNEKYDLIVSQKDIESIEMKLNGLNYTITQEYPCPQWCLIKFH